MKKEQKDAKKDSDDEKDSQKGGDNKLLKYVKKLKIFMEEEADDLFEMFETIDAGGEVSYSREWSILVELGMH